MKKRIVCAILALILMIGLVPAGAITASAAARTVSESAITVLKNLEGYKNTCNASGYTGYGTKCAKLSGHGTHKILETDADTALRAELKKLDTAVNQFATSNGLSLTQGQHDALVLFTFDNGQAWMNGTGNLKSAVTAKMTGREFLTRICTWNPDTFDDDRRMVEANMYLNGKYSSTKPANFFRLRFNAVGLCVDYDQHEEPQTVSYAYVDEFGVTQTDTYTTSGTAAGAMPEYIYQYFIGKTKIDLVPSKPNHIFLGWYDENGTPVVDAQSKYSTLKAHWQSNGLDPDAGLFPDDWSDMTAAERVTFLNAELANLEAAKESFKNKCSVVDYVVTPSMFDSRYLRFTPNSRAFAAQNFTESVRVTREFVDSNNNVWGYVESLYGGDFAITDIKDTKGNVLKTLNWSSAWVQLRELGTGSTTQKPDGIQMDVTVTVTNTYVRSRKTSSIYAAQNGTYYYGAKLRIIRTAEGSGFLWGQVAKSEKDNTGIGWVALMYTDFDQVKNQDKIDHSNDTIVAKATITADGYVNVRDAAGTDGNIVAAIPNGTQVDIYETKFVNGQRWGRCNTGWFCLSYAKVTNLNENSTVKTEVGFTAYAFSATLANTWAIYDAPDGELLKIKDTVDVNTTITNIYLGKNGITWGVTPYGWVKISDANGNTVADEGATIAAAKFETITNNVTVRNAPNSGATRLDSLSKGVEFKITKLVATSTTIWGYADKFGEGTDGYYDTVDGATYGGWVNLANKYVQRNEGVIVKEEVVGTGLIATVVGTDMVNVRKTPSMYAGIVGQIPLGTTAVVLPNESGKDGWYKLDLDSIGMDPDKNPNTENWIVDDYLNVREGSVDNGGNATEGTGSATVKTGRGIIANTYSGVNVRQTPGIGGAFMGKILPGTPVEVTQVKTVGTTDWGKVTQGWICMDYVTMLTYEQFPDANGNISGGSGSGNVVTEAQPAIYTGHVTSDLTVYTTTDVKSDVVRYLSNGDSVTIHEILTVEEEDVITTPVEDNDGSTVTITKKTVYWARTNGGYIRTPGDNIALDALDEAFYTLTESSSLVAYEYFDLTGSVQFSLTKGEQVKITNVKISGNKVNGFIERDDGNEGWVDLSKMSKGALVIKEETNTNNNTNNNTAPNGGLVIGDNGNTGDGGFVTNTSGFKYTGRVINCNQLNVRATASDAATIVTKLPAGSTLVIYETMSDGTYAWGRCDAGWVYLYYVDLTPVGGTAIDAKVVFNDNTIAYTDSSCSSVSGTYSRMVVVDIYETVGKMARTDLGWINTDNLLS